MHINLTSCGVQKVSQHWLDLIPHKGNKSKGKRREEEMRGALGYSFTIFSPVCVWQQMNITHERLSSKFNQMLLLLLVMRRESQENWLLSKPCPVIEPLVIYHTLITMGGRGGLIYTKVCLCHITLSQASSTYLSHTLGHIHTYAYIHTYTHTGYFELQKRWWLTSSLLQKNPVVTRSQATDTTARKST